MSDTEFDHDADANEYHIAVKQHLYERIRELEARVRELEADPRLTLTRDDVEALASGYGFWWRGPNGGASPASRVLDKAIAVFEALAPKEVTHGEDEEA